jgi:hypothetical protein
MERSKLGRGSGNVETRFSSNDHNAPKLRSEEESGQALKFNPFQSGSTVFLAAAICSFPQDVDPAYAFGAYCNLLISICHHGLMIRTRHGRYLSVFGVKFPYSDVDRTRPLLRTICMIDQAFVAYICLYTGTSHLGIPAGLIALVSMIACFSIKLTGSTCAVALVLTMTKLHGLSEVQLAYFCIAAIGAPLCFFYRCKIGAWCNHLRYCWHFCCGIFVAIGGVMNSAGVIGMLQNHAGGGLVSASSFTDIWAYVRLIL